MAAALMGARSVVGIDVDQDAINSAETSANLNTLPDTITFVVSDFRHDPPQPAHIVLANLTGGMLTSSADGVLAAFPGFSERQRLTEDDWIALHLTRQ